MPVSYYSGNVARTLVIVQLVIFVLVGVACGVKSLSWGVSALMGGLAAWGPNALFMLFASRHQVQNEEYGRVAWSFAVGEGVKVVITIVFMVIALGLLKAALVPLGVAYLSVLITQILAPAVINSYRT
jgi:ATP synthase protein I